MKELSIEEKAKRYDEAIKKLRSLHDDYDTVSTLIDIKEELENIFPELKESEDERIRNAIIIALSLNEAKGYLRSWGISYDDAKIWLEKQGEHANFRNKIQIGDKVTRNKDGVLVNLSQLNRVAKKDEKQGEQKPADVRTTGYWLVEDTEQKPAWSEEDTEMLNMVMQSCEKCGNEYVVYWLKSLKDRVQPKQEWSEDDEVKINRIVACLENLNVADNDILLKDVAWLKSLRPQNRWKPSDEQIDNK